VAKRVVAGSALKRRCFKDVDKPEPTKSMAYSLLFIVFGIRSFKPKICVVAKG
jgi:hypothetical protein